MVLLVVVVVVVAAVVVAVVAVLLLLLPRAQHLYQVIRCVVFVRIVDIRWVMSHQETCTLLLILLTVTLVIVIAIPVLSTYVRWCIKQINFEPCDTLVDSLFPFI